MKAVLVEVVEDLVVDVAAAADSEVDVEVGVVKNATSVTGMGILRVNAGRSRIVATSATSSVTSLRIAARALMQVRATTAASPAMYSVTALNRATSRAISAVTLVILLVTARTRAPAVMMTVASATTVVRQATSPATAPNLVAMKAATSPSAIGVELPTTLLATAPTVAVSRTCVATAATTPVTSPSTVPLRPERSLQRQRGASDTSEPMRGRALMRWPDARARRVPTAASSFVLCCGGGASRKIFGSLLQVNSR